MRVTDPSSNAIDRNDIDRTDSSHNKSAKPRAWHASLSLSFADRRNATRLIRNEHIGPLRVLKPFYPEGEVCHTYLIHPPGGLVLGDELSINIECQQTSHALITTPSAGKVYDTDNAVEQQKQHVHLTVDNGSILEWLPQETLIFNGANTVLQTDVHLDGDAKLAFWDIVCLGRPANQLPFESGQCLQAISISRNRKPLLIERNLIQGGSALQTQRWGLNHKNSFGTCLFTVRSKREERETWQQQLNDQFGSEHEWGITQKEELLMIRYIGNSASICRQGFQQLWESIRPALCQKTAVAPRIWAT